MASCYCLQSNCRRRRSVVDGHHGRQPPVPEHDALHLVVGLQLDASLVGAGSQPTQTPVAGRGRSEVDASVGSVWRQQVRGCSSATSLNSSHVASVWLCFAAFVFSRGNRARTCRLYCHHQHCRPCSRCSALCTTVSSASSTCSSTPNPSGCTPHGALRIVLCLT